MTDRISPRAIEAFGYVGDGERFLADDGTWKAPAAGGVSTATGELLTVDGVTPPENLTTEAGDDWLYEG